MNFRLNFLFFSSFALSVTSGCKSVAYFHTSNDLARQYGTIHMEDGTKKDGEITIDFKTGLPPKNFITLYVKGKQEKVFVNEVKGYTIKDRHYVPAYIDLKGNGFNYLLFVRRLTSERSKIDLFELYQPDPRSSAAGADPYSYYISFPSLAKYEVWSASGKHLVPRFDEKMSNIVTGCPALARKIQQQSRGYFYAQLTTSNQKKAEILKRIIDEYNKCK